MNKQLTRGLIIFLSIFLMAAAAYADGAAWVNAKGEAVTDLTLTVGQEAAVRLTAEIPEGKTLNAYSFVVMYDENSLEVDAVAADSGLVAENVNTSTPGEIVANAFSVDGVAGKATVALLDLKVKGLSDASRISVLFTAFGTSAADQFKPEVSPLKIVVK